MQTSSRSIRPLSTPLLDWIGPHMAGICYSLSSRGNGNSAARRQLPCIETIETLEVRTMLPIRKKFRPSNLNDAGMSSVSSGRVSLLTELLAFS